MCNDAAEPRVGIAISPHHWYLEIARGVFGELQPDAFEFPETLEEINERGLAIFPFSLAAITIVFSYMAIESFVNAQFHWLWQHRDVDLPPMGRFRDLFDGVERFQDLRRHPSFGDVPQRIKTFIQIMGFEPLHTGEPQLWQDLIQLHERARHFLTHIDPSPETFGLGMRRIMTETPSTRYVRVAEGVIGYLFDQSSHPRPSWLEGNVLIDRLGLVLRRD